MLIFCPNLVNEVNYVSSNINTNKTAYQSKVSATEFVENKRSCTLFETFFC